MKVKILAGLVTALIYGGAAMAQDVDESNLGSEQQSPDNIGGSGQDDAVILDQQDVAPVPGSGLQDQGVGGSGDQGLSGDVNQDAFGGSGQAGQSQGLQQARPGIPMQGQGGVTLYCTPVNQQSTGGSGLSHGDQQSSLQRDYDVGVGGVDVAPVPDDQAFGGSGYDAQPQDQGQDKGDMRGLSVFIGGGVEGYTGGLAPEINPGATAGVTAALRPSKVFGLELGYSGAVNNLDADVGGTGPDIVRNGAVANLTLGLTAAPIQPYVLGGFGMNWYNIRNGEALGFSDDTNSRVPVGVGLRTHIGDFTADARVNYNFLIADDFAAGVDQGDAITGSYNGTINLGGTF
ncbi:hypothetical protein JQX13_08645 [Archangium violaceum]|uniref:hypothetical protein n=1 Tax=Archangium violaceum TaxID=83451 RepID=UPI00193C4ECF|nr:hypothetical protein [Archangium violaceum]QRK10147.1 hypothetical protein JQX13_08645 [Archangium violaceum]